MPKLAFIFYKESLELKANPQMIFQLLGQSIGFGAVFPLIAWLSLAGYLPLKSVNISDLQLRTEIAIYLKTFYAFLLPFFIAQMLSAFALPSMADEIEHQTIEHLLAMPIGWVKIITGKLLFYLCCGLVCSYIMVATYWVSAFLILPELTVEYLGVFLVFFVPALVLYVISVSILVSTLTKDTKLSGVYSSLFTWGIFLVLFFLSWITKFEVNSRFISMFSITISLCGLAAVFYLLRLDSEKLLI